LSRLKYLIIGLILACFEAPLIAQQLQLPAEMVVTNRFANIRKGPGTGYEKLTTLYKDDRLLAERKYNNWLRVLIPDGRVGWIREDLVALFSTDDLPLTDEQADSLKELVDGQEAKKNALEDSTRQVQGVIIEQEQQRDSLLNLLGLKQMPKPGVAPVSDSTVLMEQVTRKLPGHQESVLTQPVDYPRRFEFSSILGVMTYDGEAMPLAGMGIARNFSREFSCQAQVSFSRLNPAVQGSLLGDVNRYFVNGSLVYSYRPGSLAVPFAELGGGAVHTQAGDSSYTGFDLVFGVGSRLFLTPDIALKFGYQGHAVMVEDNQMIHLFYLAADLHLPTFEDKFPLFGNRIMYLTPYIGYQMFTRRFALNPCPVAGLRAGCRLTNRFSVEAMGAYLPLTLNGGSKQISLRGAQLRFQVLYHFWESLSGPYLTAGGGSMFLDKERSSGSSSYGSVHFGGGFNFQFTQDVSLKSEVIQSIYPNVAEFSGQRQVEAAGALQLSAGLNLNF
jgi:Bacterial SH3 domain